MKSSPEVLRVWREKIADFWREYAWAALGTLAVLTLILGYLGFHQQNLSQGSDRTPLDNLYLALLLFTLNPAEGPGIGLPLEIARWLAMLVAGLALLQAIVTIFRERLQSLRLRRLSGHTVICGLGEKGFLLAKSLSDAQGNTPVVVIESAETNEFLASCRELRNVYVCLGDASDETILTKARVQHAKCLIAVCGADNTNADIAATTRAMLDDLRKRNATQSGKLLCIIHLVDDNLRDLLEENFIGQGQSESCRLNFFNVYDSGASTLLSTHPIADGGAPHVLVVGFGLLGQNLLERILADWRTKENGQERLSVTILAHEATAKISALCPAFHKRWQVDVQGKNTVQDTLTPADLNGLDREALTVAYVCLDDDNHTLSAALQIHRQRRSKPCRIIMCLKREGGLSSLLESPQRAGDEGNRGHLQTFDLLGALCSADFPQRSTTEVIARAIHEDYREKNQSPEKPIKAWEELTEEEKERNRCAADAIGAKLQKIGCIITPLHQDATEKFDFLEGEIDRLAEGEHERWCKDLTQAGWTYADIPRKDPDQKKHPDLVAWDVLGDGSKNYNRQQVRAVPEILARAGYQVHRLESGDAPEIVEAG